MSKFNRISIARVKENLLIGQEVCIPYQKGYRRARIVEKYPNIFLVSFNDNQGNVRYTTYQYIDILLGNVYFPNN